MGVLTSRRLRGFPAWRLVVRGLYGLYATSATSLSLVGFMRSESSYYTIQYHTIPPC